MMDAAICEGENTIHKKTTTARVRSPMRIQKNEDIFFDRSSSFKF
jgi:hypothetical protein